MHQSKTLDTDGSEHLNVFFDKIPDGAAIYYDINHDGTREIIKATSNFGQITDAPYGQTGPVDVVQRDTANKTWKLLIENYTDTGIAARDLPIIIPPHNSNIDITLKASGYAVDTATFSDGSSKTEIGAESSQYNIDVIVKGVADDVVNNDIFKKDISISHDADQDLTVTLNGNPGKYSAVVEEDMGNAQGQKGAVFNLKDIYKTSDEINSYDNVKTNDANQDPKEFNWKTTLSQALQQMI